MQWIEFLSKVAGGGGDEVGIKWQIEIEIPESLFVSYFIEAVKPNSEITGKDRTLYSALSHLIGVTDVDAVDVANYWNKDCSITVTEFRRWLPQVLSAFFKRAMEGE